MKGGMDEKSGTDMKIPKSILIDPDNNKAYAIMGAYDGSGPPLAGFNAEPSNAIR